MAQWVLPILYQMRSFFDDLIYASQRGFSRNVAIIIGRVPELKWSLSFVLSNKFT
jgi:hypothetical protein